MPAGQPPQLRQSPRLIWVWNEERMAKRQNKRQICVRKRNQTDVQMQRQVKGKSQTGDTKSFICSGGAQGEKCHLSLFVFSRSQMEQPELQTKCPLPSHIERRCIAYREIRLLSRVWFSGSTLACKIASVNWLTAATKAFSSQNQGKGYPGG